MNASTRSAIARERNTNVVLFEYIELFYNRARLAGQGRRWPDRTALASDLDSFGTPTRVSRRLYTSRLKRDLDSTWVACEAAHSSLHFETSLWRAIDIVMTVDVLWRQS
jgi:hypothetical protein